MSSKHSSAHEIVAFVIGVIFVPALVAVAGIMRALDASLNSRSAKLSGPIAQNDPAALAAGAKIYADDCAACRGSAKGPSDWGAKNFYPRAPQFVQEGSDVSPSESFAAIHNGIRYSGMRAWCGQLKD